MNTEAPRLGPAIPGQTGGLPAQRGLSVQKNPMAEQLQSLGRGEDSVLVHMTPNEVNSLQGLAMATGGSLTINPHTGLPEAGWLGKLLPTILGALGAAVGIPTWAIGLGGAAVGTAVTGDLSKGLMAGLGAYGGAGLANAAGLGGSISKNAFGVLGGGGANAATSAATNAATSALEQPLHSMDYSGLGKLATMQPSAAAGAVPASVTGAEQALQAAAPLNTIAPSAIAQGTPAMYQAPTGFIDKFKAATNIAGTGNVGAMAGAYGVLNNISEASKPNLKAPEEDKGWDYNGPYRPTTRNYVAPTKTARERGGAEHQWFDDVNPAPGYEPINAPQQSLLPMGMGLGKMRDYLAKRSYGDGGEVHMSDGAFVLDARTVSEIGNGSSNAGMEILRKMGGQPVHGPGDGVSDDVPARIGKDQPARVARDEVVMPAEVVARIGKGNPQRGADKLYALMDKAHKARQSAKRGQDTKVRKGLA